MRPSSRLTSIDCFRGFAVMLLVLSSHIFTVDATPAWFRHAPDGKLTFPDLGAPWFIFAIGLTYSASVRRRWTRGGPVKTTLHVLRRCLILFAIGFLMAFVQTKLGRNEGGEYWVVLQSLAVAIALTLPTLLLPALPRALVGLALLAIYQVFLIPFWLPQILAAPHGGPVGSLGWTSLLILCTACADLYLDPDRRAVVFPMTGVVAIAAGLALSPILPISKPRISASYVFLSLGVAILLFWVFHLMTERLSWRLPIFATWGKNPLVLYLLHYIFIALLVLPSAPLWHAQAPVWLVIAQGIALIAVLTAIALAMQRRRWIVSL
jgi:predicted acyltransferase